MPQAPARTPREHRKGLHALAVRHRAWQAGLWRPRNLGWWVALSFTLGASCFLAGGALCSVAAGALALTALELNMVFVVGAVFFTLAAWGQLLEALNAPRVESGAGGDATAERAWRWFGRRPEMLGWWACAVQLPGTLWFNVMTVDALWPGLQGLGMDLAVWTPNVIGSSCFLVASALAVKEVCGRLWCPHWGRLEWWIAQINLLGSVAFGISAGFAWVRPGLDTPYAPWWDNYFTFLGAACFLLGALLLFPEQAHVEAD